MLLNQSLGTGAKYATNTNPSIVGVRDNNLVYSVRKVVPNYTGYAIRIRRSSDSAEADVSFDSSNKISADSIVTLVSDGSTKNLITGAGSFIDVSDDAFVVTWYNQCRNTNDITIGDTGTIRSLKTDNKLSLSGDFTITVTVTANFLGASGNASKMWIMHGLESNGTTGDGIAIENNGATRGGYLKCYINGSTITASGGRITTTGTETFVISRSSGTVTFSKGGVSQGTVSNSDAISVNANTFLGGNQDASHTLAGVSDFTVSAFTVVDGSTTVYDIKDAHLFNAEINAAVNQPRLINSGSLINTSNGDVSVEFDGSNDYLSPANFIDRLADTDTGFLAYAEADSTTVGLSVTVSGAGTSAVNGTYSIYTGVLNELNPKANTTVFNNGIFYLYQSINSQWQIDTDEDEDNDYYRNTATTDNPPTSGWTSDNDGDDPAPSLTLNTNIEPVLSQYQESSGTPVAGAFYLGVDSNGWSAFLQSSTDGLNINAGGTSTLTRPTILGLGKPNSSSGTATFFRADATDGLYSEVNDTFNQSINTFYTGIGHANGSEFFDGHIVEIIVLNGGSVDETRRAFNEQRNYWGI
jgi:hypothetical protein